jgi:DNA-binding GntR family transcriptional regulator
MDARTAPRSRPRYQKVAEALIDEIGGGTFPLGSMMPTELELCERFKVSRYTVREALRRLEEMGLVARRQGSGTMVQATETRHGYVQSLNTLSELLQYPPDTRLNLLETETLKVDRATARLLQCRPGVTRVRLSGVRCPDGTGEPIGWTDLYIRSEYAEVASLIGKRPGPAYSLIEDEFGEHVEQVAVEMFPSAVPEHMAGPLGVEPGTPSMTVIRRYTGRGKRIFEVSVSVHPQDRFTYSITLKREWRPMGEG